MASSTRRKKKSVPKSTSEMSQEMLMEMLKKKKACNSKALSVVERLCEPSLPDENWFLTNLAFINQSHFEDIVTERAILKLCGYPLCKSVLENVPSKKYYISTKQNKVFDITERKNFCSNYCYKAGMYIKNQLLTSPLWFRDQEIIPEFKLLTCSSASGSGDEVVFFPEREQLKKHILTEETRDEIQSNILEEKIENLNLKTDEEKNDVKKDWTVNRKTINNFSFCEEVDIDKGSPDAKKSETVTLGPVEKVEKCIFEWFTLETVLHLCGEDKVKEIMKDEKDKVKEILSRKPLIPSFNERFDPMVKFYSMLDDEKCNSELVNRNLKPLPDYSAIKEDGKMLEVKVKAFYSGQLEMDASDTSDKKGNLKGEQDENEIYLPVVDTHAQNTLRFKILLDRLNRVIPELLRTFTTASSFNISELKNLVNHFKLSAHNITFKPGEWHLVGFIIIKLLSLRNKQIECLLKRETGRNHVTLFLMSYGLPADYLENIVEWLMNPEELIKKLE